MPPRTREHTRVQAALAHRGDFTWLRASLEPREGGVRVRSGRCKSKTGRGGGRGSRVRTGQRRGIARSSGCPHKGESREPLFRKKQERVGADLPEECFCDQYMENPVAQDAKKGLKEAADSLCDLELEAGAPVSLCASTAVRNRSPSEVRGARARHLIAYWLSCVQHVRIEAKLATQSQTDRPTHNVGLLKTRFTSPEQD